MTDNKDKSIVAIELTNKCNLKCPHCPQGRLDVPMGFMDYRTFMECLKYCQGYTELNWRGEAILHPNLMEYVKAAKGFKPTLSLGLHTNGLAFTREHFQNLAHNGLDWVHVSLHTPESCLRYKEILAWNKELKKELYVYADIDNTQEELMALSSGLTSDMFHKDNVANWAGYLTDYRIVHADAAKRAQECLFINENKFIVAWDGSLNACCWDYQQRHKLGTIWEFPDIEHQPPYQLCSHCIWIR